MDSKAMAAANTLSPPVVVIGGANVDIQGKSSAQFRIGDSNPGTIGTAFGGVGRNVAEACVRLGLKVSLITVFGGDPEGKLMEEDCRAKGMDTDLSLRWEGPNARYLCALDADGSLVGAVADMEAMDALSPSHLQASATVLDRATCIVVDTNIPHESIAWLCRRYGRKSGIVRDAGRPMLFLDTVSETKAVKALGLFGEFDCIKPNMAEARVMADARETGESRFMASTGYSKGLPSVPSQAVSEGDPELVKRRIESLGQLPGELYISLGPRGMYYGAKGEAGVVPLPPEELRPLVRNRSGAGDCALAGLVWASIEGYRPREKVYYALAAALLAAASPLPVPEDMDEKKLQDLAALIAERGQKS